MMFPTGEWYKGLRKPRWTPKPWMFPVVWTSLYILMSWAAMRVGVSGASSPLVAQALALWAMQVAFNAIWTPVFFGLHKMRTALFLMFGLWSSVLASCIAFWSIDAVAGWMMAPYVLWVSVAFVLNVALLRMNPEESMG